jgi:alkyldihydroxyacetonephosphate synthase
MSNLLDDLTRLLGPRNVSADTIDRLAYSHDAFPLALKQAVHDQPFSLPDVVVFPDNAEQISAVFRVARTHSVPVIPYGDGSGIVGGALPIRGGIIVDLKRLSDIANIDTVSQLVTVGAGVNGQRLEDHLNERGYTTGHYPQSLRSSTVGGWIAHRAIGTASTRYGGIEALVSGMGVVLPNGERLQLRPRPRSSTGPDFRQMFLGGEGAFGIITEATLRIRRLPEARRWLAFMFPQFNQGLDSIRRVMQVDLRPAVLRLYDAEEGAHLLEAAGLASGASLSFMACEGYAEQVAWESGQIERLILECGGQAITTAPAEDWWNRRFNTTGLLNALHKPCGIADALEVAGSWRELPYIYDAMHNDMRHALGLPQKAGEVFGHLSHAYRDGANLYMIFWGEAESKDLIAETYDRTLDAAFRACLKVGGTLSHHHGIGLAKAKWMPLEYGATGMALLDSVKRVIDPTNICNPGKLIGGQYA